MKGMLSGRLLLIEPNSDVRVLLRALALREGFAVVEAADGDEAIEILSLQSFDVVLLDLALPRVRGIDVLAYYRMRYPALHNVIVTSAGGIGQFADVDANDIYAVVPKPLALRRLVALLHTCAARQTTRRRPARPALPAEPAA